MKNQKLKADIHIFWYLYVVLFRTVVGSLPVHACIFNGPFQPKTFYDSPSPLVQN